MLAELRLAPRDEVRALPGQVAMAVHAAMLDSGADLLFFHTWFPAALSLGRFQDAATVDAGRAAADGIDVVRRPTGGGAILHNGDLTYAVTLASTGRTRDDYDRIAAALSAGLATLGVDARPVRAAPTRAAVCFAAPSGSDLRGPVGKICGSAQVRRRGRFLQHGSIPLNARPFAVGRYITGAGEISGQAVPAPPAQVAAALRTGFERSFGPLLRPPPEVEFALLSTVAPARRAEPSIAAVGLWTT